MARFSIDTFKNDLRGSNPISVEEEQQLGYRILKGDKKAAEILTTANLRYAYSYAEKYDFGKIPFSDILEAACFGMHEAAERFDVRKGFRFTTYANFWMKKEIELLIESEQRNDFYSIDYKMNSKGEVTSLLDSIVDSCHGQKEIEYDVNCMLQNLSVLTEKEYDVITRHFGLCNAEEETLQSIGKSYGVSREAIRQIKEKALNKLRNSLL